LAYVAGIPHERLRGSFTHELTVAERRQALRLIDRRIRTRRPLAHLLKEAWLGPHKFYVDERVIVPRSFIAELLHERLKPWIPRRAAVRRVLELCTGSGCLAVLLACAFPRATVTATDISRAALNVARRNLEAYRLAQRVKLIRADLFSGIPEEQFDLIVANPPYVDATAMRSLPPEYRREPRVALSGGRDGLLFVRRILREAAGFLRPRGLLLMEIGNNRGKLEQAYPKVPFIWLETGTADGSVFLLSREELPAWHPRPYRDRRDRRQKGLQHFSKRAPSRGPAL
jgi:ribosomal protein L3 glutamine methyltransferase